MWVGTGVCANHLPYSFLLPKGPLRFWQIRICLHCFDGEPFLFEPFIPRDWILTSIESYTGNKF